MTEVLDTGPEFEIPPRFSPMDPVIYREEVEFASEFFQEITDEVRYRGDDADVIRRKDIRAERLYESFWESGPVFFGAMAASSLYPPASVGGLAFAATVVANNLLEVRREAQYAYPYLSRFRSEEFPLDVEVFSRRGRDDKPAEGRICLMVSSPYYYLSDRPEDKKTSTRTSLLFLADSLEEVDADTVAVSAHSLTMAGINPERFGRCERMSRGDFLANERYLKFVKSSQEFIFFPKEVYQRVVRMEDEDTLLNQILSSLARSKPQGLIAAIMERDGEVNADNFVQLRGEVRRHLATLIERDSDVEAERGPRYLLNQRPAKRKVSLRAELRNSDQGLKLLWLDQRNRPRHSEYVSDRLGMHDLEEIAQVVFKPSYSPAEQELNETYAAYLLLSMQEDLYLLGRARDENQQDLPDQVLTAAIRRNYVRDHHYRLTDREKRENQRKVRRWFYFGVIAGLSAMKISLFIVEGAGNPSHPEPVQPSPPPAVDSNKDPGPGTDGNSGDPGSFTGYEKEFQQPNYDHLRDILIGAGIMGAMALLAWNERHQTAHKILTSRQASDRAKLEADPRLLETFKYMEWLSWGYPIASYKAANGQPQTNGDTAEVNQRVLRRSLSELDPNRLRQYLESPLAIERSSQPVSLRQRLRNRRLARYVVRGEQIALVRTKV